MIPQDSITQRLESYPVEKLLSTKARMNAFWRGENPGWPIYIVSRSQPVYQQVFDLENMLDNALECLTAEASLPGDGIPAFYPDLAATALASAFGGRLRFEENGPPWIDPIVYDAGDINKIPFPAVTDGLVGEALRRARIFVERTGGKIPVRMPDMQGPLNTSALLWEQQDFLMAMRTHPSAVHQVVNLVTEFIIAVYHAFQQEFQDLLIHPQFPPIWLPPGMGVGLIEDLLPLISAAAYREFGLPYTKRIADEFGGLAIHCCGECERHLPALAEIPGLRFLDFHYPHTRPEVVQEILGDGLRAFSMELAPRGSDQFRERWSFFKFQMEQYRKGMRLVFFLDITGEDDPNLPEVQHVLGVPR